MQNSVWNVFQEVVNKAPHQTALIYLGTEYSYSELYALSESVAGALHRLQVEKGDRVMVYLPHCPQWVIAWFAIQRLGAVAVPVPHSYGSDDLRYIAKDSGARVAFCCEANFASLKPLMAEGRFDVIFTNTADHLPWWKELVNEAIAEARKVPRPSGVFSFDELSMQTAKAPQADISSDGLAEILYTSGSTGLPKGVPFSHDVFVWCTRVEREIPSKVVPRGKAVIFQGSPLYHILGQAQGLAGLLAGDTLVLLPRMEIEEVLAHIDRYHVNYMFGTPIFYRMLLEHPKIDKYDLSCLLWCYSGGDYLPPALIKRWKERTGKYIYQGLGSTEACGGITMTPGRQKVPEGSIGKVVPTWMAKLIDPETMEEIDIPGQGELLISSDHMFRGYWNKPEETSKSLVTIEGRLWLRTGDIVRIDKKGWVFFLDRTADVIKHKGYRVVPSKVERILTEHPSVVAACVVGIPDPDVGEKIKALVISKKGELPVKSEGLKEWCSQKLAPYEVPHWVEFRDSLPTSPSGKVLRRKVRAEEREKAKEMCL